MITAEAIKVGTSLWVPQYCIRFVAPPNHPNPQCQHEVRVKRKLAETPHWLMFEAVTGDIVTLRQGQVLHKKREVVKLDTPALSARGQSQQHKGTSIE
jgi:hypothetical protein